MYTKFKILQIFKNEHGLKKKREDKKQKERKKKANRK